MDRFSITADFCEVHEEPPSRRKKRRVKKKKTETECIEYTSVNVLADIKGVCLITVSIQAQASMGCTIGTDITSQTPWKYISKAALIHNVEIQEVMTLDELAVFKEKIEAFTNPDILICYKSDNQEVDEFYVCSTPYAEAETIKIMDIIKKEIEYRLDVTVNKTVRPWKLLGSEKEVDLQIPKINRPLLELEIESEYPIMTAKCFFKLKMVEDRRDGYSGILPGRTAYQNVTKKRVDACTQVSPSLTDQFIQTICTFSQNVWTQYKYEYVPITHLNKDFRKSMNNFVQTKLNNLEESVILNSHINFYRDDYITLSKGSQHKFRVKKRFLKEIFSFVDFDTCKGKTITNVSWHHMWTGTVAIAYSTKSLTGYSKGNPKVDEVTDAIYNVTPVLLWCFNNNLVPKLYLETPREVSAISFCPYDENILVGGCVNGQIVIWDITNKIDKVEKQVVLTTQQQSYRTTMNSLIKWMKNTRDIRVVRADVVSNLTYSHTNQVTNINWISPYREVSKSGQVKNIPESQNRTSLQFLTSSTDGKVLVWDMKITPASEGRSHSRRGISRLKSRPQGLTVDLSPYTVLNRVFKPIFQVNLINPKTGNSLPLTYISIPVTLPVKYIEKYPNPERKYDRTERIYFEPLFLRLSTHSLTNELTCGTLEGDFLTVSWEGFTFNAGEDINKENGKIEHISKFHDGPLVTVSRSYVCSDLILTVGGKIFALWLLKESKEPVFWRRSRHKYTFGVWNTYMPSVFRLTRSDGHLESWSLKVRSDSSVSRYPMSGGYLGGTFTHPLKLKEHIIAVSDYNGCLRLFSAPGNLMETEEERWSTYRLCKREADRKLKIQKWQQDWNARNSEFIRLKREKEEAKKQILKEEEEERRAEKLEKNAEKIEENEKVQLSKHEKWRKDEEQRMHKTIMDTKNLDVEQLKRLQVPLLKIEKANEIKRLKLQEVLKGTDTHFSSVVQRSFPSVVKTKHIPPLDPYVDASTLETKSMLHKEYVQIKKLSKTYIRHHEYQVEFNWSNMIKRGNERRRILDGFYGRSNHKDRLLRERRSKK